MIPVGRLLLSVFASVTAFGLWRFFRFAYHLSTSPLRRLRGPKGTSWLYGNLQEIEYAENFVLHSEEWVKRYGSTLTQKGFFCRNWLFTVDMRALDHILTHSSDYQKPPHLTKPMCQIIGEGLIFAEGDQHRQQRRIMNPAFRPAQIRALTDIFLAKAVRLREVWSSEVSKDPAGTTTGARLDVMPWLGRVTLDVIGLAGFNYSLDSLNANEKLNELDEALTSIVTAGQKMDLIVPLLQAWFPPLRFIPSEGAIIVKVAQATITRICKELLSDAKATAQASVAEIGDIKKNRLHGQDLLSLLIKANMAADIPESQRLSDEDVLAQVSNFLFAGRETITIATTWALYAMTNAPGIQTKLREELLSVDTETPSMDELMALPYLDAVVKETLRVHSPFPNTERIAMKDDELPVEKPFADKYGVIHDSIRISKGDLITIPILMINLSQELWGPDAHEFKPERWANIPEAVSQFPGMRGHLFSFVGGPRACIAYQFSLVQMKALLFTLVRAFEFELAVPASEIRKKTTLVQRPVLRGDPTLRPQLPLFLKPYKQM